MIVVITEKKMMLQLRVKRNMELKMGSGVFAGFSTWGIDKSTTTDHAQECSGQPLWDSARHQRATRRGGDRDECRRRGVVTKFAEAYHAEESDCLKDPRTGRSRGTKLRRCGLCDHGKRRTQLVKTGTLWPPRSWDECSLLRERVAMRTLRCLKKKTARLQAILHIL